MNKKKNYQLSLLFLVILFFKNLLISQFAVKVPFDDQWDSELMGLYVPYEEGTLKFSDFFNTHNEHRIFFTRLFNLGIYILNQDRWDSLLVIRIQSILASLVPVLFIFFLFRNKRIPNINLIYFGIICSLPLLHENLLWGFQNQFYFFQIFAILAFSKLNSKLNWKDFFWILLFSACAYFSMASGALVPVAIGIFIFLEAIVKKKKNKLIYIPVLIFIFFIFYSFIPFIQGHQAYKPREYIDFERYFKEFLYLRALLFFEMGYYLIWLPILICMILKFKKNFQNYKIDLVYLIFLFIILLSTAYSRGLPLKGIFTNRYQDSFFLVFILITSILFFKDKIFFWFKNLYFLIIILCLFYSAKNNLSELNMDINQHRKKLAVDNYYLYFSKEKHQKGSGNEFLLSKTKVIDLPYPNNIRLIQVLSNPTALFILKKSNLDKP